MRKVVVLAFAIAVIGGCGKAPHNGASPSPDGQNRVKVQQTAPAKPEIRNKQEVTQRLETLAASIPQVQSAKCVILGNTAIVGINVEPHLERSRVDVIKYSVAEALRKDPYGVHAFVTADVDMAGRIAEIREAVRQGRPIAGFAEELADMIGRIVPQIPKDITPQGNPPARTDDAHQMGGKEL
ncbi:YhcN/YlaJ family sporulation lipoprotein [Paenibacillus ginsengarvi]|uniref:YhcN/YlaJ family sporulation lipoprotein n=1 Tax=Paenibacillus ginsengarvi TaxID=400777 RepID=A0A3B0CQM7_9BACL|nr:YhcN/YlaJ family sporulation lipoprotein [Paenibacillus ginsengarvi]RKN86922.1 YhcN/YlaJ family sporulation lipoprotein [Paenibacillus ginsengarvi]